MNFEECLAVRLRGLDSSNDGPGSTRDDIFEPLLSETAVGLSLVRLS